MREVSQSEFMRFAVSQTDETMYNVWNTNPNINWDMNGVLNIVVGILFMNNEQSSLADYVREIVRDKREGNLAWVS